MVSIINIKYMPNGKPVVSLAALSTDTLPITTVDGIVIENGSDCYFMDTQSAKIFDKQNKKWLDV